MFRFQKWFLPDNLKQLTVDDQIKAKYLAVNAGTTIIWGPGMSLLTFYFDSPITALIILVGFFGSMTSVLVLKFTANILRSAVIFIASLFSMFAALMLINNGTQFGGLLWILILPLLSLNSMGLRPSIIVLSLCLALLITFKLLELNGAVIYSESSQETHQTFQFLSIIFVAPVILAIGLAYYGLSRTALNKEREINQTKNQLISNVSHELRTPLNGILGIVELLKHEGDDSDKRKQHLQTLDFSSHHLLGIVNDILDLSEAQSMDSRLNKTPYRFKDNVKNVISSLQPIAQQKGLSLDYEIDEKTPEILVGDSRRIDQLLINFLGNALKFTHHGEVYLYICSEKVNNQLVKLIIKVSDTGIGIPANEIEHLFDAFYQVDDSSTRQYSGSGLGLAICRQLIESMQGDIDVSSELGKGTTFRFSLLQKVPGSSVSVTTSDAQSKVDSNIKRQFEKQPRPIKSARILLVEDNEINQMVLKRQLELKNQQVTLANHGQEALDILASQSFDLILMDAHMPVLDGYAAARCIRDKMNIKTPIIAVTAGATNMDREKCISSGMNEVVTKPIARSTLDNLLVRWLS
ncbi:ATP-binding protein [Aliikangiella sp. G2MR2-5]|uniref:ATP-binding protein n=1 Tax=Aliikangiella sp. G2MR2-5 TaxID=2788943 RepID=UPI0018A8D0A2|nr:ATP-binding protein [Aliikangiella sp. G2MR2-5]